MPLSSLTPSGSTSATATKTPLGIFPPAPMRRSPGHTLMLCGLFCVAVWLHPLVGAESQQPKSMWMTSNSRSFEASGAKGPVRRCVHGHALAVADDQRVRPRLGGVESSLSLALACSSVGHASLPTRSHFTKLKMPGSERMFSVSSCLCPPRMSWLCSNGALRSPARPATAGSLPAAGTSRRRSAPRRPPPASPALVRCPRARTCAPSGRPSARSARSSASWTPGAPPRPALAASPQWPGAFRCPAGP